MRLQELIGGSLVVQLLCPDKTKVLQGTARQKSLGMWNSDVQNKGTFKVGRLWVAAAQSGLED